uniref:Uncharacterized protein n=1 Tax=Panagrolaimus superbus TaxID=310955 RepID=A0A914YCY7_9BILA
MYFNKFFLNKSFAAEEQFTAFQDPMYGDFGLRDSKDRVCLFLKFKAKIYNFNLNGTDIALELADLSDTSVSLNGFCALTNEVTKHSFIEARWKQNFRKKALKLTFVEKYEELRQSSLLQLRWQLTKVVYEEIYDNYQPFVLELLPAIDMQPMNIVNGFGSNIYLCDRTRSRTLSESFQSQMTIVSGIVLGLSSVGTLIGYSLRRLFLPARQQIYNSLG